MTLPASSGTGNSVGRDRGVKATCVTSNGVIRVRFPAAPPTLPPFGGVVQWQNTAFAPRRRRFDSARFQLFFAGIGSAPPHTIDINRCPGPWASTPRRRDRALLRGAVDRRAGARARTGVRAGLPEVALAVVVVRLWFDGASLLTQKERAISRADDHRSSRPILVQKQNRRS